MPQTFSLHPALAKDGTHSTRVGLLRAVSNDAGAATAEYAIAMMAAVGFAGMLVIIMRGDEVRELLTGLVRQALSSAG